MCREKNEMACAMVHTTGGSFSAAGFTTSISAISTGPPFDSVPGFTVRSFLPNHSVNDLPASIMSMASV